MAKQRMMPPGDSSITFVVMNVRGSDETIQSALKTIGSTLNQHVSSPARRLPPQLPLTERQPSLPGLEPEEELADNVIEIPEGEATQEVRTPKQSAGPRKPPRSPQPVNIDLNSGEMPLNDFLGKHDNGEIRRRYLLCAYWLKKFRQLDECSADHIHTCFKNMHWPTPKDAMQPLRDMKSRSQWFGKGSAKGLYAINHLGENEVMDIMKGNG